MATTAIVRLQTVGTAPAAYQDLFPMASSTVLANGSGRFLTFASGVAALTIGSDTHIDGWTDDCYSITHNGTQGTSPLTTSATSGGTVLPGTREVHTDGMLFWMPAKSGKTFTTSHIGLKCDLDVSTNFQGVDPDTTSQKHVQIVNVDIINNLALVKALV